MNGRECAGKIISIGERIRSSRLKVGDRVFVASSNYRDIRTSCFQERCVAFPENCGRIPDHMSYESAAGLGVALIAGAAALYESLKIPRQPALGIDSGERPWILIWATASTAGILATQLAKASGFRVIGVSSTANFAYTKDRGVDITLDREEPEEVVRRVRPLNIKYAIDCVGSETAGYAARALGSGGTLVALVKPPKQVPENVNVTDILIKKFHEDRDWGDSLMRFAEVLLQDKRILPPRLRIVDAGLAGIPKGLGLLQDDLISGEKVVVRVCDTPKESEKRGPPISRPTTPVSRPNTPSGLDSMKRRRVLV